MARTASLQLQPLGPTDGRRVEQVILAVRRAVDQGRMTAGVKYSVYHLAEVLGVSRTPVRDALLRMEEIGMIEFEARQGFRILLPRPQEIAEIFAVRLALEVPAARRAARTEPGLITTILDQRNKMHAAAAGEDREEFARTDMGFHDLILEAAGNGRVRTIIGGLRETTRLLGASTAETIRSLEDIDSEHTPIADAIAARDPDQAAEAMRSHLVHTGKLLVAQSILAISDPADPDELWDAVVM